jgi:arylsulfatase A-like enzyme
MRPLPVLTLAAGLAACKQPDVIFITVDTLRADHVGALSADSPAATPRMDALAADGVTYTQAWAPISVTGPSFCTLHTGLSPSSHGVTMNLFRGGSALPDEVETVAEGLAEKGYRTAAFVSGFTLRGRLNLDQGFTHYDQPAMPRRMGKRTTNRMLRWIDDHTWWTSDLFLWWHTYDPHGPLDSWGDQPAPGEWPPDPAQAEHLPKYQALWEVTDPSFYATRYVRAVEHTDGQVGRILDWLKESERYDDALIVLTADHGESFTERELWFDHGTTAAAEQLHVPLIIKYPKGAGAGSRVDALVGLQDVLPTVYDVLGLPLPEGLDGHSLRAGAGHPLLTGESSHCKREGPLSCAPVGPGGKELAARDAAFTLVRRSTEAGPAWQLYDRKADPAERSPQPADAAPPSLREAVEALAADRSTRDYSGYENEDEADDPDKEEQEALKALGYVEGGEE